MDFIVDHIREVVAYMREEGSEIPYYMSGHPLEIANRLLVKDRDRVNKSKKYPLVALRLDTVEEFYEGVIHYNLNVIIMNFTNPNYNAEQRVEEVFKPVLYPLYHKFMNALKESGIFMWPNIGEYPRHRKIDRFFYGTPLEKQNVNYIFNDPLDAIEILDLKINKTINCE